MGHWASSLLFTFVVRCDSWCVDVRSKFLCMHACLAFLNFFKFVFILVGFCTVQKTVVCQFSVGGGQPVAANFLLHPEINPHHYPTLNLPLGPV